jgi:hypothetical protein
MASARSFMNATPNEEFPSEETSFLNIAPLPKKKKTIIFEMKKRKSTLRGSHIHTKKTIVEEMRMK